MCCLWPMGASLAEVGRAPGASTATVMRAIRVARYFSPFHRFSLSLLSKNRVLYNGPVSYTYAGIGFLQKTAQIFERIRPKR